MRVLFGCGLVLALVVSAGTAADDKIDPAKLVGKWTPVDAKVKATTEFTKDGKVITTVDAKGKELKFEGSYKLDGDKLTIVNKRGDKEIETVSKVTKLTDDDLVFETEKPKKTDKLKRVK